MTGRAIAKAAPRHDAFESPIRTQIGPFKTPPRSLKKQEEIIPLQSDFGWHLPIESAMKIDAGFAGFLALV
jgi:hypothetical protein